MHRACLIPSGGDFMSDIIGTGWRFPVQTNVRGGIAMSGGASDIEEAICIILLTPIGQRTMRPAFGCRVHELLFEPANAATVVLARRYVIEALAMWEPRIRILEAEVQVPPLQRERLEVLVRYEIKSTYDKRALIVPFYRIPGD